MKSNCQHPQFLAPLTDCKAVKTQNVSDCDCRWCVFNKEFNKANRIPSINI